MIEFGDAIKQMSNVQKCDRCGKVKESLAGSIDTTLIRGDVDLCNNCVFLFKRFIKYNEPLENYG